jgi:hypothetical protein
MALFKRRNTEVMPAPAPTGSITERISTSGGAIADRATQYYRENPKKVQGAALLASAVLLGFLKKRGTAQ